MVKLECANHIVRGYTDKLYKLKANTALPLSARKELTPLISRLTKAARGAITSAGERAENVDQLRKDLRNGPHHVFGDHAKCVEETVGANGERVGYCRRKNALEKNKVPFMTQTPIWAGIFKALEPIVAKADRLMLNVTTNQAEHFMGLVACASGGKRVDHTKRGGYQLRCTMAGLRHIKGPGYFTSPAKKLLGHSPGMVSKKLFADRARNSAARNKRDSARRSLGFVPRKKATSARAGPDADYGPSAAEPDISAEDMEAGKNSTRDTLAAVACSDEKRANLERATVGQAENPLWIDARQNRLTASKFGAICNRKPTTSCHSAVISITNPKPIYSDDIVFGNNNEPKAIEMYEERFESRSRRLGCSWTQTTLFWGRVPTVLSARTGSSKLRQYHRLTNWRYVIVPTVFRALCFLGYTPCAMENNNTNNVFLFRSTACPSSKLKTPSKR